MMIVLDPIDRPIGRAPLRLNDDDECVVVCVGSSCLWAHVVGAYLFTAVMMAALYKEYQMVSQHTHISNIDTHTYTHRDIHTQTPRHTCVPQRSGL